MHKTMKKPSRVQRPQPTDDAPATSSITTRSWSYGALEFESMKDYLARKFSSRRVMYTVPVPNEDGSAKISWLSW